MDYNEALAYINDKEKFGSKLGLDSIGELLKRLGNPQKKLKYIHVAGTNGKGSTTAFLSRILIEEGYNIGIFTSPYLESFNERIRVNETNIENDILARFTKKVKNAINEMLLDGWDHPTTFEIVTAIAFLYFYYKKVDYVVLEVGLGGRLDSTNIIEGTLLEVITSIDFDHVDILGDTLSKIAYEKAGIIKENSIVVSYPQKEEVRKVLKEVAEKKNSKIFFLEDKITIMKKTESGSIFDINIDGDIFKNLEIELLGEYQVYNAALALYALIKLRDEGFKLSDKSIRLGLKNAKWNGRMELLSKSPKVLIDGAHNLQGIKNLKENLDIFKYNKLILSFSVLKDKDYKNMIKEIVPLADEVIITEINMDRKLDIDSLYGEIYKYNKNVAKTYSIDEFVESSNNKYENGDLIIYCGSLYLIGEIRKYYN